MLMCYVATHPEKLDATKEQQWQKLAGLSPEDMSTVTNLEFLGVPVRKRGKATGLNFGRKRKRAVRKASRTFEIQISKMGKTLHRIDLKFYPPIFCFHGCIFNRRAGPLRGS